MDRSQLLRGVLDAAVLAIVKRQDGYGYDVVRRLRAAGLTDVGDASVYGTLRRLYRGGALTSYVVPSDEGPHRRYYGITERGQAQLDEARETWMEFGDGAQRAAGDGGDHGMSAIGAPDYLQALERELADLAPDERADLLEEVEASLLELDDDPVARLGPPAQFAAELRESAGLPPVAPPVQQRAAPAAARAAAGPARPGGRRVRARARADLVGAARVRRRHGDHRTSASLDAHDRDPQRRPADVPRLRPARAASLAVSIGSGWPVAGASRCAAAGSRSTSCSSWSCSRWRESCSTSCAGTALSALSFTASYPPPPAWPRVRRASE